MLLIIGVAASFLHRIEPSANPEIAQLNKERSELKTFWNTKESKLDNSFKSNALIKSEYFIHKKINEINRVKAFKQIAAKRRVLASEFSFNGRSSLHYWLWVFGMTLTTFIISCYLANKDARLRKVGLLKWYEPFFSISFIAVSLFWLYHTLFMEHLDFKTTTYLLMLLIVVIPLSYFLYHFIRRTALLEYKLLYNIRLLVSHVLNNTKEDKEEEKWNLLDKISQNGR